MKNFLITLLMFLVLVISAFSQEIKPDLCKEFNDSKELYVIKNNSTVYEFTALNGDKFTFWGLVKKDWSDKEVKLVSEDDYNKMKDVKSKFHITISIFTVYNGAVSVSTTAGINIQKGKTGTSPKNTLYWLSIDLDGLVDEKFVNDRLIYAVKNLQEMLAAYPDKSKREKYNYKCEGCNDIIKNGILYIKMNNLSEKLQTEAAIKKIYPYDVKVVTWQEWEQAFKDKKENVLMVEYIYGGRYAAANVYRASDGKLIMNGYPFINDLTVGKSFFKKLVE